MSRSTFFIAVAFSIGFVVSRRLPLDRAAEAYDRMMSGKARFRVVLTTGD